MCGRLSGGGRGRPGGQQVQRDVTANKELSSCRSLLRNQAELRQEAAEGPLHQHELEYPRYRCGHVASEQICTLVIVLWVFLRQFVVL